MPREKMSDVIVVVPGIMGSVLQKDGKDVWSPSAAALSSAVWNLGSNITDLATNSADRDSLDFDDGVVATRLMPDVHLIPWLWKIDGYGHIADKLKAEFEIEDGKNYFEFPYDWRLDNRIAANKLQKASSKWLSDWRQSSGNNDAKLIMVAHSMGGLISRYFTDCLEGWRDTRLIVTFGTPFRGSLNAVNFICNGFAKKIGPVKLFDFSEMLRSFTSVYQLLPTFACIETAGGAFSYLKDVADLPNVNGESAAKAYAFHDEIKKAVENNSTDETYANSGYTLRPIVGMNQPTSQSARFDGQNVEVVESYAGKDNSGDGTVPRISAVPVDLEQKDMELFANAVHGSLQNTDSNLAHLSGVLRDLSIDWSQFKGIDTNALGLKLDDGFDVGEEIDVKVRCEGGFDLIANIINVDTGQEVGRKTLDRDLTDWQQAAFPPLPEGTYRLNVTDTIGEADPISDVFVVLPR